jgi:hypothetical protein
MPSLTPAPALAAPEASTKQEQPNAAPSYVDAVLFGRRRAPAAGARAVLTPGLPVAGAPRATNNKKGTGPCAS